MSKEMLKELKNMLCDELEEITRKGELTAGSLETVDKLTHSIKSIDTIIAMDESGYSEDRMYENNSSYARGRGRGARRDSMGRYSSRRMRGYSRDGGKDEMIEHLREMWDESEDPHVKSAIKRCIEDMED